jgi:alpha-tubulin suppressor-like RCC1 family protein
MESEPNKWSLDKIKKNHAYVWAFGTNQKGELSVGHYKEVYMPERVKGLKNLKIVHLSSGAKHTGAVTEDGKLMMCGSNLHDKLGLENITTGSKKTFKLVTLLNHVKVKQVACGDYHTLSLTDDGNVYVWGGSLHNKRGDRSEERK